MKHALLITAYKNFDHLKDVISFFDNNFCVYIHIDRKIKVEPFDIDQLKGFANVKLISRKYRVNWGGINHLKCILHLAEQALLNKEISMFHLISGHDYPIKNISYFLNIDTGKNYLNYHELPSEKWKEGGLNRLMYYNFYDLIDAKKHRDYIFKLIDFQKKIHFKRRLSKRLPKLFGGETWWTLNNSTLRYVLDYTHENPRFLKRLRHTFCSEEIYFQTIIMNSPYALTVINDSLRYIDWNTRNGNHPANLDESDLKKIIASNKLFARKFEFPVSQKLKACLLKTFND
ncbi:beta-1,6-N-acetylglucosaminyltransferase [Aestuariivivens marinum]|uniref:beta-1,6-N-acetylglucosaminyltransferase n=1 Tax=Aestuariivivens marinum TaxID=2913555 RepID=UPI001F5AA53B|nr:beta-1,6-N-acetylglucosaminyltransferase [Aestuariivivens marinum]